MGPKTLLACLTTREHANDVLNVAIPLAERHGAHLIGLHATEAITAHPGIAVHVPQEAFAALSANQRQEANEIEAIFRTRTEQSDAPCEWRMIKAEFSSAAGQTVDIARICDLVVMARPDPEADRYDQRDMQARVIRESGRPVLIVPPDHDGTVIGQNILLGWSDTREAARAAHDLLSIAATGATVNILRVLRSAQDEMQDSEALDLAGALARHGLAPKLHHRQHGSREISDVLQDFAFEQGADLIATGAFGHSRAYDFVIGAVSHDLLKSAKIPVLFSK